MAIGTAFSQELPESLSAAAIPPQLARLFQRLEAGAPGYTWDSDVIPFHSVGVILLPLSSHLSNG